MQIHAGFVVSAHAGDRRLFGVGWFWLIRLLVPGFKHSRRGHLLTQIFNRFRAKKHPIAARLELFKAAPGAILFRSLPRHRFRLFEAVYVRYTRENGPCPEITALYPAFNLVSKLAADVSADFFEVGCNPQLIVNA